MPPAADEMLHAPPGEAPPGMRWIPGGRFRMGSDVHYPEEAPAHEVRVDGFWMDATTVTNAEFAAFIAATGYVTIAERPLDPDNIPARSPNCWCPARWSST